MEEIYKNVSINNLEGEEWRDIEGYNGKYQVSNYGRVKSLRDNNGNYREIILKQRKHKDGYLIVNLWKEGKMKTCRVHRLVAQTFIPNPSNMPMINHKDEIKTDNRVENLEWCTAKYNQNYGTCQKRRVENTDYKAIGRKNAEKQLNDLNKSKKVYQYTRDGKLVKIWQSTRECGRNGFDQGAVAKCCRGEYKHYKGYLWSYTEL